MIQPQSIAAIPGSTEPMKPVKVKTVQVKAGQMKLASAGPPQSAPPITSDPSRSPRAEVAARPANADGGAGLEAGRTVSEPEHSAAAGRAWHRQWHPRRVAGLQPAPRRRPCTAGHGLRIDPTTRSRRPRSRPEPSSQARGAYRLDHSGRRARERGRSPTAHRRRAQSAHGLLSKADPFTEPVVAKGDRKLYRARFAGLERDQAEAVCKTLKRAEISCITMRN